VPGRLRSDPGTCVLRQQGTYQLAVYVGQPVPAPLAFEGQFFVIESQHSSDASAIAPSPALVYPGNVRWLN